MKHRLWAVVTALILTSTLVFATPALALTNYRCSQDARSPATASTHHDGWTETGAYPNLQPTGIAADINYLQPYAHIGSSSWAWVMLDDANGRYAQVGVLTTNTLNVQRTTFFTQWDDGSGFTTTRPSTGTEGGYPYQIEVVFRRSGNGGNFYFYVQGLELPSTRHTETNWQPVRTDVVAETHNYADQMGGTQTYAQAFNNIVYEFKYLDGFWHTYGTMNTFRWIGSSPSADAWYGRTASVGHPGNNPPSYLYIWDRYCPN